MIDDDSRVRGCWAGWVMFVYSQVFCLIVFLCFVLCISMDGSISIFFAYVALLSLAIGVVVKYRRSGIEKDP